MSHVLEAEPAGKRSAGGARPRKALLNSKRAWRLFLLILLAFPWVVSSFSSELVFRFTLAGAYALAGLSVVVLTGWLGQVSLAQGALMGIGAFTAGRLAAELSIPFPWGSIFSAGAGALAAVIMGAAALRLRGLYLAVATLSFQYAVEESLLQWRWFGGFQGVTLPPLRWGLLDFSEDRIFFYLAWITFLIFAVICLNLRDSKIGRAWLTIKEAEPAAAAVGIPVTRYRLGGFALSGALAGISGSVIAWQIGATARSEYLFQTSILVLAVAVIGGINSVWGVAAAASIFGVIAWGTAEIEFLAGKIFIVSGALLLISLFLEPGGIAAGIAHARERRHAKRAKRKAQEVAPVAEEPLTLVEHEPVLPAELSGANGFKRGVAISREAEPVLRAGGVTVRFGGITACDDVDLDIRAGELVGLVGPNGAGKTTLLGVLSGFVSPQSGRVFFKDQDITRSSVHARASMGMARTFQISRVITSLSVLENLLVGSFLRDHTKPLSQALQLPSAVRARTQLQTEAREVAELLGLSDVIDVKVASLPLASARLVEVGRALLTFPTILLLDEPASGLDRDARELLAERLAMVRDRGIGLLLIEHDFELVSSLSDRVYVLDYGSVVAQGDPAVVSRDPRVIQAYLGDRFALAASEGAKVPVRSGRSDA